MSTNEKNKIESSDSDLERRNKLLRQMLSIFSEMWEMLEVTKGDVVRVGFDGIGGL